MSSISAYSDHWNVQSSGNVLLSATCEKCKEVKVTAKEHQIGPLTFVFCPPCSNVVVLKYFVRLTLLEGEVIREARPMGDRTNHSRAVDALRDLYEEIVAYVENKPVAPNKRKELA